MVYAQLQVPSACMNIIIPPASAHALKSCGSNNRPAGGVSTRTQRYAVTMFGCPLCGVHLPSLSLFLTHFRLHHASEPGFRIQCGFQRCQRTFYQLPHLQESRLQQVWWKQREFVETNQPVSEEDELSHDYSTLESECDEPLYPNKVLVAAIIIIIIIIISHNHLFLYYFSLLQLLLLLLTIIIIILLLLSNYHYTQE